MHQETQAQQIEIFRTSLGTVYQCNRKNVYVLEFQGYRTALSVSNLLDFTKKITAIDLDEMVKCTSPKSDIALIMPHYTERCFVLTLTEVIALRELLCGAKAMIQLNSMVNECLLHFA